MPSTVWKGHLTFGLVSIPVKLHRAARPDKVNFRQLHQATGARIRQALTVEPSPRVPDAEPEPGPVRVSAPPSQAASKVTAMPLRREPEPQPEPEDFDEPATSEVSRAEIVKGYEYARDRYVTITKEELAAITPQTAREMQILEFVQLTEIDPVYFETSYYVSPDRGGERAYALLFEALRQSAYVGLAQVAMHNREHIVVIRPARTGMVLHTMFYETEIRRDDEYRTDLSNVSQKEMDLALLLIRNLAAPFEAAKYRDTYREKLDELIQKKIAGEDTVQTPAPAVPAVVNILDALQKSLAATAARKPPVSEQPPARTPSKGKRK